MSEVMEPVGVRRYTKVAMGLHWLVALLLLINVGLGLSADYVPDDAVRAVVDLHKSIGITVLGLVLLRILWRLSHKPPALPPSYGRVERGLAHAAHAALYVIILALPLTGWLHDSAWRGAPTHPVFLYGLVPWPRIGWIEHMEPHRKEELHSFFFSLHAGAAYVLYGLLALHILGALKHQFWDREAELQRMLPGR